MDFTHIDDNNNPTMVDVTDKAQTQRIAIAQGKVWLPEKVRNHFHNGDIISKKGPVFSSAIIAGTLAVKQTANLIPFCHQINLDSIKLKIELIEECANIECYVKTTGKTGVEMEAIVGVNIAAATIYDMCKAFGHEMIISEIKLLEKRGGKSDFSQE